MTEKENLKQLQFITHVTALQFPINSDKNKSIKKKIKVGE